MRPRFEGRERKQARAWMVRLQDAHSSADREAFEQWLAEDPAHADAYQSVSAAYADAGVLRTSRIGRSRDLEAAFPRQRFGLRTAAAAGAAAALLFLGGYELRHVFAPTRLESVMLSSGAQARRVTLADGSGLEMAPSSEVRIEIGRSGRLAEIRRGRVRLSIRQEDRPFRIVAGSSIAEANGGSFEARIVEGQGVITHPDTAGPANAAAPNAAAGQTARREAMEFSAEPLGNAIERINAVRAGPPIEIDPRLSNLRVTGVFQQGSSTEIASSLALAFGLELSTTPEGRLRLAR